MYFPTFGLYLVSVLKLCYKQWAGQTRSLPAIRLKVSIAFQTVICHEIHTSRIFTSLFLSLQPDKCFLIFFKFNLLLLKGAG